MRDIFKAESICIDDDEELNTINPDDFLNESFFKTESEVCHERRNKTKSESSSGNSSENASIMQLTPPISPQPLPVNNLGVQLIPIATLHAQPKFHPIVQLQRQHERKNKHILPAKGSGSSDSDSNVINDNSKASSPVDKALIKHARLIRNRESALQSRRKKKEYVQNLEVEIGSLRKEICHLKEENSVLKSKLKSYGNFTCRCASSITNKLATAKNTTFMLAFVIMIGLNFIPIGNFFSATKSIQRSMTSHRVDANTFNARHLLFAENISTSSDESNSSEIPLYFNQTDRIRKTNIENVLNWIPQPDLFNASRNLHKDYDFTEDPLQDKLAKMFEKSRDQMQRKQVKTKVKRNNTKKNNHAQKIQQNLYNPNFFKLHEFFDEINRKEDTFYVFSFRGEHLLLPALDYPRNFSQIVKMNLIMPRNNGMQADAPIRVFLIIFNIFRNTNDR